VAWTGLFRNNVEVALPGSFFALRHVKIPLRGPLITLEFAALVFAAPEMNSFAYRLEPRDRQWTSMIPDHRVALAGLAPGRYTLRVKAANPDGVWNETGIAIGLDVPRPFWKTWWFLLIALVFLAAGAALGRRIRKRIKTASPALDQDLEAALGTYDLTGRELEIMRLVLQGASNKDIERKLFISSSTVRNHIYNVYQKLGVGSRLELINRISKEAREMREKPSN
jgi:DNA-binding CsgD family transcriptional regulator